MVIYNINAYFRKFIGDTADDNSICKICFEPSKLRCSKCQPTFYAIYCSLYCQKLDWNDHKAECVGTLATKTH